MTIYDLLDFLKIHQAADNKKLIKKANKTNKTNKTNKKMNKQKKNKPMILVDMRSNLLSQTNVIGNVGIELEIVDERCILNNTNNKECTLEELNYSLEKEYEQDCWHHEEEKERYTNFYDLELCVLMPVDKNNKDYNLYPVESIQETDEYFLFIC